MSASNLWFALKWQLELVIAMVDWLQKNQKRKAVNAKRCNFFNRRFCKEGLDCRFDHSEIEICERFLVDGICLQKDCNKRHLYKCKYLSSPGGCFRGDECAFSHDAEEKNGDAGQEVKESKSKEQAEKENDEVAQEVAVESKTVNDNTVNDSVEGAELLRCHLTYQTWSIKWKKTKVICT